MHSAKYISLGSESSQSYSTAKNQRSYRPKYFQTSFASIYFVQTLEKHIHKYLILFIEDRILFHHFQSGFRRHHSCHTALIRHCDTWLSVINKTQLTGAVFLDLKKAFDLVDHSIFLKQMFVYLQNLSFLTSYLQDRTDRVVLNGQYSTEGIVECGIPQGLSLIHI